ncbi:MAG: glycosyltransferase family 2 protein [Methylocystis sp.]|uniref:glycosyltransferase family 2 protein n=1 Tax=Methylocystis sp. TaxID=1911079 RepID=UPI003DA2B753
MTKRGPAISCVIPVYRAAAALPELYRRLLATLTGENQTFEIIFVEDCGGDASWEIISAVAAKDPRVRGVRMSRNYGQHNAILCGIREARGEIIITMDDDLQHPPEELPKLLAKLAEGFDVVYGPPREEKHGTLRNLASMVTKWVLQEAMAAEMARQVSALRAFRTELREAFANYQSSYVNIDVLLTWATTNFGAVTVRHEPRTQGESGYTTSKLVRHAFNMITGFSTLPLQMASITGLFLALFGFCVLFYVLVRHFMEDGAPPGFPFLASIIAIFSGAQLFSIGIIGEYIARMHSRAMDRPVYAVRSRTKADDFTK